MIDRDQAWLIAQAQAAYARCIDTDELERWPDFFAEKCFYMVTTADNYRQRLASRLIWADSHRMLLDRVSALRKANIYKWQSYRHILGPPEARETDSTELGDIATDTGFLVVRIMWNGSTDVCASGRYLDRWALSDNDPKLTERIVVCDSKRIDTLLALPL
ncbi:MAG TPA: aromatic-ring-hydroxylating dioxygenase subunit beta [Kribbella sp.]